MESHMLVIAMLFIIIVYVTHTMYDPNDPFLMSGLFSVGVAFLVLVYYGVNYEPENLVDRPLSGRLRVPDGDVVKGFSPDSPGELNYADGMYPDELRPSGDKSDYQFGNDELDNADVVNQFITGGANTFNTGEVTSANFYEVHDLAYPKKAGEKIGYAKPDVIYGNHLPLNNDAISIDDKLTRGQIHRSEMNKRAIDGQVRATRDKFSKYFANELPEAEASEWWNNQAEDEETDYKYFQ